MLQLMLNYSVLFNFHKITRFLSFRHSNAVTILNVKQGLLADVCNICFCAVRGETLALLLYHGLKDGVVESCPCGLQQCWTLSGTERGSGRFKSAARTSWCCSL